MGVADPRTPHIPPVRDPRIILLCTMELFYRAFVSHIGVKYPAGCSSTLTFI